jgi:hypothetical protein
MSHPNRGLGFAVAANRKPRMMLSCEGPFGLKTPRPLRRKELLDNLAIGHDLDFLKGLTRARLHPDMYLVSRQTRRVNEQHWPIGNKAGAVSNRVVPSRNREWLI